MAGCQMIDLLRRGQKFHEELAAYCRRLRHHTRNKELREALSVVRRHETWLAHCMETYARDAPAGVTHAWFKVTPDNDAGAVLKRASIRQDMEPDEAIALALACDECLARLFERLASMTSSSELRDALTGLLDMERSEEKKLARQLLRN